MPGRRWTVADVAASRRAWLDRPKEPACRICGEQPQVIAHRCRSCDQWYERQSPLGHRVIRCLTIYYHQTGVSSLRQYQDEPWLLDGARMIGPKSAEWLLEVELPERAISWPVGGWAAV